jgi:hypothetical protein
MFNREVFLSQFAVSIEALAQSEDVTKRELRTLSRTCLEYVYETGDIGVVNRLMLVLTPVNRKVAQQYFDEFAGFVWDDTNKRFKGKSAKRWDQCVAKGKEFLADPMNNIWSWAERNIEVARKDFDIAQVTDAFKKFVKKAEKNNLTQRDVLKAVLSAGVELDTILDLMGEMYDVEINAGETQPE